MIPTNQQELEKAVQECQQMVHRNALLSAGAGAVPAIGVDVAADVGLLMKVLPDINRKFGLAPSQINEYDAQTRMMLFNLVSRMGTQLAGKVITKKLVISILKKMGVRLTAKQAARVIPFFGSVVSGGLSYAAMRMICNRHIQECADLVDLSLRNRLQHVEDADPDFIEAEVISES